jgi:Zn-finger nucleic acid-binding protein
MMFMGSRHCPHCGVAAARDAGDAAEVLTCPRCTQPLESARVGGVALHDCARCGGVWLDADSFREVTTSRESQAAVLAFSPLDRAAQSPAETVRYAPCPSCGEMMNRVNFARISGVVLDTCRRHGTWFDRDELRRIVEFIRAGGLEASRERERIQLEDERRRLEQRERALPPMADMEAGGVRRGGGAEETLVTVLRFLGLGL